MLLRRLDRGQYCILGRHTMDEINATRRWTTLSYVISYLSSKF